MHPEICPKLLVTDAVTKAITSLNARWTNGETPKVEVDEEVIEVVEEANNFLVVDITISNGKPPMRLPPTKRTTRETKMGHERPHRS